MSTMKEDETKIVLPRVGPDLFLKDFLEVYAGEDRHRWRLLGILLLHEIYDWPINRIGKAFGITKGQVARSLHKVKNELKNELREELHAELNIPTTFFTENNES